VADDHTVILNDGAVWRFSSSGGKLKGNAALGKTSGSPSRNSRLHGLPTARKFPEPTLLRWPIVQGSGIEIRSVRPHERLYIGIDPYLIE
jgi:hypothetical protein